MRKDIYNTVKLGELVEVVFDEAKQYSNDPREISHLATRVVMSMLRRARNTSLLRHHRLMTSRRVELPDVGHA